MPGFTLIELLVVIAIIAILASLLLPAIARAKGKALSIKCVSQFKQLGIATEMFANDNDEEFPGNTHSINAGRPSWVAQLVPYLAVPTSDVTLAGSGGGLYRCPTEKTRLRTYVINDFLTYRPPGGGTSWGSGYPDFSRKISVPQPTETMWMGELSPDITIDDHFHFVDKAKAIPGDAAAYYPNSFFSQVDVRRHQGSANYLFVDSHVESLSWTHVKPMLKQVGCRFVKPDGHQ